MSEFHDLVAQTVPLVEQQERFVGEVIDVARQNGLITVEAKNRFAVGDQVERKFVLLVQQAEQDAVVVDLGLDLDARPFPQGTDQGQLPRPVDASAKRRVNHQPWVADRVLKDLDQDRAIGRERTGVLELSAVVQ